MIKYLIKKVITQIMIKYKSLSFLFCVNSFHGLQLNLHTNYVNVKSKLTSFYRCYCITVREEIINRFQNKQQQKN